MDFGCATYCKFADQCLQELPPELLAERKNLLKNRVAIEMKRYFETDFKRIGHATKVARYAEEIINNEKGDMAVVLIAAYLHDIGIKEAEKRYQSSAAGYQEELGPPVAREILESLGADARLIDEVCDIIGHHHHPRPDETDNFKALYDADMIVNLEDAYKTKSETDRPKLEKIISMKFFTEAGKTIARNIFLNSGS
jgi:CRISPR/Cas system-associated endonuclease Cas3-HD